MWRPTYVICRTASGRPTTMHELVSGSASETICGRNMYGWSRHFVKETIALNDLRGMLCGSCARSKKITQAYLRSVS